ncbi:MAG: maleylacetoacetate isomerase [Alphaproteobacteria bacterium]|nr:maleylacetoacetate isomerase [Alphaproteobacteria bacterium]
MELFTYYRSSASYRVRIALNMKGLEAQHIAVNLLDSEQRSESYGMLNPQKLIPALMTDDSQLLTQSLAILEYLEERYPDVSPLLPKDILGRARVRSLAQSIACEISPLNNLRVLRYLVQDLQASEEQKLQWYRHWIHIGFEAVEAMLQQRQTGQFCHGNSPGMADCCLVPQIYNAQRFDCDLERYPTIMRIGDACAALPAFADAHPAKQADTPLEEQ